ncbi:Rieske iron-sulfur protein [Novosphingobium indicum]|uniref:Rieske iron-sulfur protein n=2 Tax=Novosphingobium indicum TaxID=462949 RepID=A0ABQ2JR91_9SPHN|nr:Rieske iron-sulfur protein [Novosphingobium indicum]
MSLNQDAWWAVARSEEVTSEKPLSVDIGDQPVVLWRDNQGIARAMEDRCPHRRAPLSLGCVRDNGWIQCGYHGWSFDGETGRLKEIPNMKDQQRFPPVYKANAFGVTEQAGLVRVCLNPNVAAPLVAARRYDYCGTANVSLTHREYLNALYDDPSLLFSIRGVHFTSYLMAELHEEDGKLVMERSCQWAGMHWPAHFVAEFPLTLLTKTDPVTGETELLLRDDEFRSLFHAVLAPVPSARGVTAVRWRASQGARYPGLRGALLRGINPLTVFSSVNGTKLRTTKPSVSMNGEDLREAIMEGAQPSPGQTAAA